jgi:hypothetical protein
MRVRLLLCALALASLQPGCSFFCYGVRNLVEAPINALDNCQLAHRAEKMADAAWADFAKGDPGHAFSVYYAEGFKCGFASYIEHNGNGEPPTAPPWVYQTGGFETAEGHEAIRDWFAGFRLGAAAGRESGFREAAVALPLSRPPYHADSGPATLVPGGRQDAAVPNAPSFPAGGPPAGGCGLPGGAGGAEPPPGSSR